MLFINFLVLEYDSFKEWVIFLHTITNYIIVDVSYIFSLKKLNLTVFVNTIGIAFDN